MQLIPYRNELECESPSPKSIIWRQVWGRVRVGSRGRLHLSPSTNVTKMTFEIWSHLKLGLGVSFCSKTRPLVNAANMLRWKWQAATNSVPYDGTELITIANCLKVYAPGFLPWSNDTDAFPVVEVECSGKSSNGKRFGFNFHKSGGFFKVFGQLKTFDPWWKVTFGHDGVKN